MREPITRERAEEILETIRRVLEDRPEIVFAYAHGSFLDSPRPRDLDLAVFVNPEPEGLPALWEGALEVDLEEAIGRALPVDVRILNRAPTIFRFRCLQGRLLLDRDPDLRAAVTADAACRYNDLAPFLAHYAKEAYGHDD
ncbi:nucleotidyltransferase domain-containing protein [Deferrisoma camini]|uniref:nucleotidyltransferase domain-containing protein n=1 Tax=Deferrisoma camini TaxID=1035120 RepID=UPI00046C97D1|nr:nucleotidyltransferase domain-containing protein [Deferrisoma camini]